MKTLLTRQKKKLKQCGMKHIKNKHLISYIEHEGKRTKNSIGILINVNDVSRKSKYKGVLYY